MDKHPIGDPKDSKDQVRSLPDRWKLSELSQPTRQNLRESSAAYLPTHMKSHPNLVRPFCSRSIAESGRRWSFYYTSGIRTNPPRIRCVGSGDYTLPGSSSSDQVLIFTKSVKLLGALAYYLNLSSASTDSRQAG